MSFDRLLTRSQQLLLICGYVTRNRRKAASLGEEAKTAENLANVSPLLTASSFL